MRNMVSANWSEIKQRSRKGGCGRERRNGAKGSNKSKRDSLKGEGTDRVDALDISIVGSESHFRRRSVDEASEGEGRPRMTELLRNEVTIQNV